MKQLRLILVIILLACWVGSWAKGKQTITINGLTIGKSAKKITFSGEKAMITYADGSKQTENMGFSFLLPILRMAALRTLKLLAKSW